MHLLESAFSRQIPVRDSFQRTDTCWCQNSAIRHLCRLVLGKMHLLKTASRKTSLSMSASADRHLFGPASAKPDMIDPGSLAVRVRSHEERRCPRIRGPTQSRISPSIPVHGDSLDVVLASTWRTKPSILKPQPYAQILKSTPVSQPLPLTLATNPNPPNPIP